MYCGDPSRHNESITVDCIHVSKLDILHMHGVRVRRKIAVLVKQIPYSTYESL